jgi:hypothetical protein
MRQDLDAYNMESLQAESEALDLRTEVPLHRSAVSVHQRMSSSLYIEDKTALLPPIQGVILEARLPPAHRDALWPQPVRDYLDSLIVPKTTSTSAPPLGLMFNPMQSHLISLVKVEAGVQLPPFCLVTQDLPSMSLSRPKVVAGSVGPSSIVKPSAQSRTKPLTIPAGWLRDKRLQEIKEGVLRHNQECREVQDPLNRERQRLHRVAVRYGLSTNLWTAIILMIPILLHEAEQVNGFLVYDCSHDQLKTQTIYLTEPKNCKDPITDYHPARMTEIKIILTDGDTPYWPPSALSGKPKKSRDVGVSRASTMARSRSPSTSPWRLPIKSAGTPSSPARSLDKVRGWTSRSA